MIALQLAVDRPDVVQTLALLEPPLAGAPSAGAFFEKQGPAFAAYGAGDGEGAMSRFLSVVSSLDWETCQRVIEQYIPGGVARAMAHVDDLFGSYLPALQAWPFGADQAAAISQPVLSVVGTDSERLFLDGHELLHTWFPQIEDCRIEGVAHLLHMQRPEPVARGLAELLRPPSDGCGRAGAGVGLAEGASRLESRTLMAETIRTMVMTAPGAPLELRRVPAATFHPEMAADDRLHRALLAEA